MKKHRLFDMKESLVHCC